MDVSNLSANLEQTISMPSPGSVTQSGQTPGVSQSSQSAQNTQNSAEQAVERAVENGTVKTPAMESEKDKQANARNKKDVLEKTIEQINKSIQTYHREMRVSVHEKTRQIMVKVWDTDEDKVIREIPPEKALDVFAQTLELAGIMLDKKS